MSDLFNHDAETAVLSIILKNPSLVYGLINLKYYMFSVKSNEVIYRAVEDIIEKGLLPECRLIESYLDSEKQLESSGGKEYLVYLQEYNVDEKNLKEFERLVISSYKARSLIKLTSGLEPGYITSANIDSIISNFRASLDNISESGVGESTQSLDSLVSSSWDEIYSRAQAPGIRGVTSGIDDIDLIISGLNPGEPWVIGARPGMGKTAIAVNMALKGAQKDVKSLIFSLEMSKQSIIERMLAIETNIPLTPNIRMGQLTRENLELISSTLHDFKSLPILIDANFTPSLEYLESTIRKYKKTHDIDVVYIDYLQLLTERGNDATHEIGRITRSIKLLSNELNLSFVVLSQLNRNLEMRDNKRPILADFRQSGNIEEDFDLAIGLYRDSVYNKNTKEKDLLEFIINKNRNGPIGTIPLKFNENTIKITNYKG